MPERVATFEDSIMPRSTIKACARTVLHADTSIKKEALTALAKGSSVFISYLTTYANDIATSKKRKTIMPNDVFDALKTIQFERFVADLKEQHEQAEEKTKDKKERKKSANLPDPIDALAQHEDDDEGEDLAAESRPPVKKARVETDADDTEMTTGSEGPGQTAHAGEGADDEQDEVEDEDDDEEEDSDDDDEDDEDDDDEEGEQGKGDIVEGDHSRVVAAQLGAVELDDIADHVFKEDEYDEVLDNGEDSD